MTLLFHHFHEYIDVSDIHIFLQKAHKMKLNSIGFNKKITCLLCRMNHVASLCLENRFFRWKLEIELSHQQLEKKKSIQKTTRRHDDVFYGSMFSVHAERESLNKPALAL